MDTEGADLQAQGTAVDSTADRAADQEVDPRPDSGGDTETDDARAARSARAAAVVFGVYVLVAFPILMYIGRDYWFFGDAWGLLADRSLEVDDLFRPQNRHWSTIPILYYRGFYRVFGLHSHLPYMAAVIALRLGAVVLVRMIMRRAGVGPWVATIAAMPLVLFGVGNQNYFLSIQFSMMASLVCGLGHLLLADHDGPFDRRDAAGLGLGLVGLMASGVAPPLVAVVGAAVLVRRGWRMALVHTLPLAAIYGVWFLVYRDDIESGVESAIRAPSLSVMADWVWVALSGVFMALGDIRILAIALLVVLLVGLFLAWTPLSWSEFRQRASMPLALFGGAVLFIASVSWQRWVTGTAFARSPRYVDIAALLVLPLLAVAANAVVQRWKPMGAAVLILFVVGIPANVSSSAWEEGATQFYRGQRNFVLGAAHSELADQVRPEVYPDPNQYSTDALTMGFLVEGVRDGRIPEPGDLPEHARSNIINRLSMSQSSPALGPLTEDFSCERHTKALPVRPQEGERFGLRGPVSITIGPKDDRTLPTIYNPSLSGDMLTAEVPGLRVQVSPVPGDDSFFWCTEP